MQRLLLERRIRDVHARLQRARQELAVIEEQLAVVADGADDARVRSLVSETPLATHEYSESRRHAEAMARARDALRESITDLQRRQDELLSHVGEQHVSADPAVAEPATRVVIAEDEAIVRLDLKEILESAGYDVVGETGRGDEAVTLVAQHQPDLAILDIKMPGMDGVRAAREITANHKVAVLVLTAFSQRDFIEDARDAGVHAYLVKPFRRTELLPAIEEVLARCRQEWAIEEEAESLDPSVSAADDKIETRRLVDQAKELLMDRHDLEEAAAFSFIQRTAMQSRTRMRDVARQVIDGTLTP